MSTNVCGMSNNGRPVGRTIDLRKCCWIYSKTSCSYLLNGENHMSISLLVFKWHNFQKNIFFIPSMGDPLRSLLSFGLRIQAHSQAKSLPTCVQRTKDNISNIAFKIFKKSRQFYWRHAHAHSTHTQIVGCLTNKPTLSLWRLSFRHTLWKLCFKEYIMI